MAEINWEDVEKLVKMSPGPGSGIKTGIAYKSGYLPIHTSVDEEELAKVTKENEKLLSLIRDIAEALSQLENKAPLFGSNEIKNLNTIILSRIEVIIDGK